MKLLLIGLLASIAVMGVIVRRQPRAPDAVAVDSGVIILRVCLDGTLVNVDGKCPEDAAPREEVKL